MGLKFKKGIRQELYDALIEEELRKCEIAKMSEKETKDYIQSIKDKYYIVN